MKVSLKVNGKSTTVDAPSDMPLLWVLRDVLDLKGTKYGCGVGQCGACTVHYKGAAVRSCQLPVSTLQGAEITTIEGLSSDGAHPVQRAWDEIDVPQCGYCQAGQIMSAAALLEPASPGRHSPQLRRRSVTINARVDRRQFLRVSSLVGGGLLLGTMLDATGAAQLFAADVASGPSAGEFTPNAWIRLAPDGSVTIV